MSKIHIFKDGRSIDLDAERPGCPKELLDELKQSPALYDLFRQRVNAFNRKRYQSRVNDPANGKETRDKIQAQRREWRKSESGRKHLAAYMSKWRKGSQGRKIQASILHAIWQAMFMGWQIELAESYLGCTIPDYCGYLNGKFEEGMSWDNYGNKLGKWCIDHIKPIAMFDLTDPEQVKVCFNFQNTQPIWFRQNSAKWHEDKAFNSAI